MPSVGAEKGPEIGGRPSGHRRQADKRTAYAAKLRKDSKPEAKADSKPADEPPPADPEASDETKPEGGDES